MPGVELRFFAKEGEASERWDRFIQYLRRTHPEAIDRPVVLARDVAEAIDDQAFVDDFEIVDVSPTGLFIPTTQRFAIGTDVRIKLLDVESMTMRTIDGVVRRRTTGDEPGIAVEYRHMTDDAWGNLVGLIRAAKGRRGLRGELRVVRAPTVQMTMETIPGPWSSDEVPVRRAACDDSWSIPPESGWT